MTTTTAVATAYLARVRAELSDLPTGELEDVLDDVAGHLDEIALEFGDDMTSQDLEARLGTPQEYAAELRTAAGYPPQPRIRHNGRGGIALALGAISTVLLSFCVAAWSTTEFGVGSLVILSAIGLAPGLLGLLALNKRPPSVVTQLMLWRWGAQRVARFTGALPPSLRRDLVTVGQPGWWLFRGASAGTSLYVMLLLRDVSWDLNLPGLLISGLIGFVVSVWLGRRSQRDRRWLWVLVPANVALLVSLVVAAYDEAWQRPGTGELMSPNGSIAYPIEGLMLDGTQIFNLFAFDDNGKVLKHIRLYDDNGGPVVIPGLACSDGLGETGTADNVFPKPATTVAADASCTESINPGFAVPPFKR